MENLKEVLKVHKISDDEYQVILDILKREPNLVEIGIFSAMWSEHCSYKSSRHYLKGFPTTADWVIQGPGENAGVIDIGGDYAVAFKMESHNHPSFIEPFQGAATGVGGVLRDIFTMGARPIANMNSLRFGMIDEKGENGKLHRRLLAGAVDGISSYGNCMGIAMVGGETTFDECYNGNILVNAFGLGLVHKDKIFYGRSEGIGNPVIYVGSKTGRDGLGGAVMSSDSFGSDSKIKKPTVQVGDPFTEKLLLEACMELFATDLVVGIQDMGAAGLTSSSFEMAGRSGSGMKLYLDRVPAREEGMTPYEFMLSESQERMLLCAKKGSEDEIIKLFKKYNLEVAVVGEVSDTGNMELFWHGERVAHLPIAPLAENAPCYTRPIAKPKYLDKIASEDINRAAFKDANTTLMKLISHIEVADKSWIYSQYDSTIGAGALSEVGASDSGVFWVKENGKGVAMSADCNPRFVYVDPKYGSAAAVAECGRNVAMSGARALAITDCLNFGNPENPEVMWQFKEACEGIKEACLALNTPVVSGNVSLYNETNGESIYPTPSIAVVGVLDDPKKILTMPFKKVGNSVYLLGKTASEFGGSLYMKAIEGKVAGKLPQLELTAELKLWDAIIEANNKRLLKAAHDVSIGGIAVAVSKMMLYADLGFEGKVDLEDIDLFSESFSRAVVEVENDKEFEALMQQMGVECQKIGVVTKQDLKLNSINQKSADLKPAFFESFAKIMREI